MCIGIALALPFLAISFVNKSLARVGPIASALAGFSYTLYLTHRPTDAMLGSIFGKADDLAAQSIFYFGLRLLICLAVAVVFYVCFERNTPTVRNYLRNRTIWMWKARRTTKTN
jgi:peptidoglycan/LPS O-acetylase OafA/YrhL